MIPNTGQTPALTPRGRGLAKPTSVVASEALPKPTRKEETTPAAADIAVKAYEIWLAQGQEMGHDQQHWFEAERQLRNS